MSSGKKDAPAKDSSGCSTGFIATLKRIFGRSKKSQPAQPGGAEQAAPIARSNKERKALEDANLGLPIGAFVTRDVAPVIQGLYGVPNRIVRAVFDPHSRCCVVVGADGTFDVFGVNGSQAHGVFDVAGIIPIGVFYDRKTVVILTEHHARFYHPTVTKSKANIEDAETKAPAPTARNDVTLIKTYAETEFKTPLRSCDFLCGEEWGIIGDDDGTLYGINLRSGELSRKQVHFEQVIAPRVASNNSNALLICRLNPLCPAAVLLYHARGKLLNAWDLANNKRMHRYHVDSLDHISAIQWHHKGDRFFTAHHNGYVCLWKFRDNKECLWQFPMVQVQNPDDSIVRITKICVAKQDEDKYLFLSVGGNACQPGDVNADHTPAQVLMCKGALKSKTMERYVLQENGSDATFLFESNQRALHRDPYAVMSCNNKDGSIEFHTPRAPFNSFMVKTISLVFSEFPLSCYNAYCGLNMSFLSGAASGGNGSLSGTHQPSSLGLNSVPKRNPAMGSMDVVFTGHENGSVFMWDVTTPGMRHMLSAQAPVVAPVSSVRVIPNQQALIVTVAERGIYVMQWSEEAGNRRLSKYNMVHFGSGDLSLTRAVVQAAVETKSTPKIDVIEPSIVNVDAEVGFQTFAQIDLPEFGCIAVASDLKLAVALRPNVVAVFDILRDRMHFEFTGTPDHNITAMTFYEPEEGVPMLLIGCDDGNLWVVSADHETIPMMCLCKKGWSSVVDIIVRVEMCPVITDEMRARIKKEGEAYYKKLMQQASASETPADSAPTTPKGVKTESSILSTTTTTTTTAPTANLIDEKEKDDSAAGDKDAVEGEPLEMKPRTLLLLCMQTGVMVLELTQDDKKTLKAREAFATSKYSFDFCSYAIVNSVTEKGSFLAGVDPSLQCITWNLYQLSEIRKLDLASHFRIKDSKIKTRPTVVPTGSVYAFCGQKRIGVCTLQPGSTQHTLQYAEDVSEVNTQEPTKLRLTQRWTTLGLPFGQSLKSLF